MKPDPPPPMPPSRSVREERVTSTGWRVVGKAVSLVADAEATAGVPTGRDEDVLFLAKFQMRPRIGAGSAVTPALAILSTAIAADWSGAPPLTRDRPITRPPGRFHGMRWATVADGGTWTGELAWRRPHPVVSGAPCTTHVILTEHDAHATLAIRVTADGGVTSVRGTVGAGQARPAFLSEMNRALRLVFDGGDCAPRPLDNAGIDSFVRDLLLADDREYPVAVLSPLEEGGYAVPPEELAEELLGLAHLYVIDRHPTTFRLTDTLGDRRLSCYWGALRVYMAEFSCADRPEEHPLLFRDRLVDPVIRADLIGKLGRLARRHIRMPPGIAARQPVVEAPESRRSVAAPPPANAPEPLPQARGSASGEALVPRAAAPNLAPDATIAPLLHALAAQLGQLGATISNLVDANTDLASEIARMRTTNAVRAVNTTSLERRIGSLERLIVQSLSRDPDVPSEAEGEPPDDASDRSPEDDAESLSLVDVLRQAATAYPDALLILEAAERSAADSPYMEVDRLAIILDAMAGVARRRQEGVLGTSLRDAFRELGIDYRGGISAATSEKHRKQYVVTGSDGRPFDCREHIVLGTSYDPRHCLRVYFTSRAPVEPRFVIGHVGRHFDVVTTT